MKKAVKLVLSLLFAALICGGLWASTGCPRLSPEAAFRRVESRQLLPESTFVTAAGYGQIQILGGSNSGHYQQYTGVGVTQNRLHVAQLLRNVLWWHAYPHRTDSLMVSYPLTGDLTAGILPHRLQGWHGLFAYSPLESASLRAELTIGRTVFTHEMTTDPSGYTQFYIPALTESPLEDEICVRGYDLQGVGYGKDRKSQHVTLTVKLLDAAGQVIACTTEEYPVY